MKHFRISMTINVFVDAEDLDQAHEIAQEMGISFSSDGQDLEQDLIDWDIDEVEK